MNLDMVILLGIIAFTILAFTREWMSMDIVAMTCLGLLLVFDLVTPEEAISGFGNTAVITVMMMFVLSEGLVQSGLIAKFGNRIARFGDGDHRVAVLLLLVVAGVSSAFINNTAAVGVLMPVAIKLARHFDFSPSKILLPLSYMAIIGGTCTLLGTSTNLLVSSLSAEHGEAEFTVFEFLTLGSILFLVGLAYYVFFLRRYLPSRSIISSLTRKYHLTGFLTEVRIPANSKLINKTVLGEHVSERFHLNVLEIIRGKQKITSDLRNTALLAGDVLLVRGSVEDIVAFRERYGLLLLTDIKLTDADLSDHGTILAEVQITSLSRLLGSTIKDINFRKRFGSFVLGINSTGQMIRDKLALIPLKAWDTLLVFGPRSRIEALYGMDDFVRLGESEVKLRLTSRWWISGALIPIVVLLATLGWMPILKAAILGVVVLLVTRRVTTQQAYRAIDWTVIVLLAAILPLGRAMENTGLAESIGSFISQIGISFGPTALLSVIYLATSLLTSTFSNNATAVLMVPIAFTTAAKLGVDPKPLLMAVTYAASASFMTPMSYQTNAMVFGPGNYKFIDYLRYGAPLNLIFWILSTILIPILWPF
ncbi:MAG: SLC13 family permease [Acidobacteria bacterium]|nr:SLC13 family permease [Acidobacteriota bacterium]